MTSALDELLLRGLTGRTPWKAECDACATVNITRSGEQTVDGVALVAGDRCLLTAETASKDNGIWVVSTGSWARAEDFASIATCRIGSTVVVTRGTTNDGVYRMTVPTSGDVTPGVTAQTWTKIAEWDTAAGSYTAGDGLTLTGSDFDLDLTDTTKFTDAGVASRAVVLDASSRVVANGIRRTSGNFAVETVTSGTLTITSAGTVPITGTTCSLTGSVAANLVGPTAVVGTAPSTGARHVFTAAGGSNYARVVYDGAGASALTETCLAAGSTIAAAGTLGISATALTLDSATIALPVGGCAVAPATRTTDAAPGALTVRGGSAHTAATGGNKVGGALRLGGGRGDDPGTDLGGDVRISLGRHIADNTTAECAFYYGDATDDDFENKLLSIERDTSARCLVTSTPTIVFSSGGQYVVSASTEVQIEAGGGSYGSLYLGSGLWQQYMPGGHEVVLGPSAANRGGRKCPARVTPGSAAATAIGTFTVPANSAGRFRGTLTARNGAGNAKSWDVSIEFDADGSNVTVQAAGRVFTVLPGNVGTITTVAGDLTTSVSGLVVTVTAANGSGYVFSLTGCLEV